MILRSPCVLVTGGAKRLGKAIALGFAQAGWDVAVHYNQSHAAALSTVAEIETMGRKAAAVKADLANAEETSTLLAQCSQALELPTALVNNAAIFDYDTALDISPASLDTHLRTNLYAPVQLAKALFEAHDKQRVHRPSGVVINLLDQKLANPNPDYLSYTLSKAALLEATHLLARAYAPVLRVVGLAPGITLPSGHQDETHFAATHRRTPLGKSSTPHDIAEAAVYLAQASSITGTTLYVDGGQHLIPSARDVIFLG